MMIMTRASVEHRAGPVVAPGIFVKSSRAAHAAFENSISTDAVRITSGTTDSMIQTERSRAAVGMRNNNQCLRPQPGEQPTAGCALVFTPTN